MSKGKKIQFTIFLALVSMSVYVPNYEHDIFVSYAHVDDQPFAGAEQGWVTTLINGLKILLGKQLGNPNLFSLWMDYELRGNLAVTNYIIEKIENSAILIVILSPAYLMSQWCRLELNTFLTQVGENSGCLFVVEHDVVERPSELDDLLGYQFWIRNDVGKPRTLAIPKPHPEEFIYYQLLDDLARQLTAKLKELKKLKEKELPKKSTIILTASSSTSSSISPSFTQSTTAPTTTLFLAEATDDLIENRQIMKRFFEQHQLRVLPNKTYSFANLQASLEHDLRQCHFFIQLLSHNVGNGYPQFQYECAKAANLPIFQWRDPVLELKGISDQNHQTFLALSTVIAINPVEFQTYVLNKIKPKENQILEFTAVDEDVLVFINAAPEDMALAHKIKEILDTYGIGYSLPLDISITTTSTEIRQYLEQNLLSCDAVLVIYDCTSVVWVNEQLLYCRRMQRQRDQPLKKVAVYHTPSTDKPALNLKLPNMQILECSSPHQKNCLSDFLQSLGKNPIS
jgi:hypothetical protein